MKIVVHVDGFYDWQPVPGHVEVSEADIAAKRVQPSNTGGWLMRVPRREPTYTDVSIPENQILAMMIEGFVRDGIVYTRKQAVGVYMSRYIMPHHAHRAWTRDIEMSDDGPVEADAMAMFTTHVNAGTLHEEDLDILMQAYLEPAQQDDHVAHLRKHLCSKKETAK